MPADWETFAESLEKERKMQESEDASAKRRKIV